MSKIALRPLPPDLASMVPADGFQDTTILVIGDLMLDRYVIGDVNRISPEAPVPIVSVGKERATAGGAGNVALNLAGLRAKALACGVVGKDHDGAALLDLLNANGIDVRGIVADSSRPTTCKTRVMSGSHQLVRVDREMTADLDVRLAQELKSRITDLLSGDIHSVLLSDYAKGVLTEEVLLFVIDACVKRNIPVFVDPKRSNYSVYANATCLTPNLKEFHKAAAAMFIPYENLASGGKLLRERLNSPMLLITQGAEGMTLFLGDQVHHFEALAEDVFDVSGAGDTVVSTFAAAFAAGVHPVAAVELANIAAGIVVRKVGTAPIAWDELCPVGTVEASYAGAGSLPLLSRTPGGAK